MKIIIVLLMICSAALTGCASNFDVGANSKMRQETLTVGKVSYGTVVSVRNIAIQGKQVSQYGATGLGAVIGGAIGNAIGKNSRWGYVYASVGTAIGGSLGNTIGSIGSATAGQEVIIKSDLGGLLTVTQAESALQKGQRVALIESYGKVRVIPA